MWGNAESFSVVSKPSSAHKGQAKFQSNTMDTFAQTAYCPLSEAPNPTGKSMHRLVLAIKVNTVFAQILTPLSSNNKRLPKH